MVRPMKTGNVRGLLLAGILIGLSLPGGVQGQSTSTTTARSAPAKATPAPARSTPPAAKPAPAPAAKSTPAAKASAPAATPNPGLSKAQGVVRNITPPVTQGRTGTTTPAQAIENYKKSGPASAVPAKYSKPAKAPPAPGK